MLCCACSLAVRPKRLRRLETEGAEGLSNAACNATTEPLVGACCKKKVNLKVLEDAQRHQSKCHHTLRWCAIATPH